MGFDCGFDMVPRLNESKNNRDRWLVFIDVLKKMYNEDPVFQVQPRVIVFQVGEYPRLPLEGHKFLRFSSKVSGRKNISCRALYSSGLPCSSRDLWPAGAILA